MDKPTIFFSHSSKDKELILPIKNKILDITGRTMDIFMSSDGQSIPLGRNWVSKIEEGLEKAQIMFIFVTPNSMKSDWIYFEAGYAYSKNIEVIPVGIGVHIGELKAPLNLLQGFDILSSESMNNFISVINKKFSLSFKEVFDESDYELINHELFGKEVDFDFSKVFDRGEYTCHSQYKSADKEGSIIRYDVDKFYNDIKEYISKNEIQHSFTKNELLVNGINIKVSGVEREPKNGIIDQTHTISFTVSTYNFKKSFELLIDFFKVMDEKEYVALSLYLNMDYKCLTKKEQLSSIVSSVDALSYANGIGTFKYMDKINWWIRNINTPLASSAYYTLGFSFKQFETNINDVIDFMNCLYSSGIIYKS